MRKGQAIEISRFGGPEVLRLRDEDINPPEGDEVLIETKAIGLNFADIFERMGLYDAAPKAPFVPGFEISGVIAETGGDVKELKKGDRVIGVTRFGGYKTLLKISETFVRPLPDTFSFEEGAGFPTTYLTAYHGLFNTAHIKPGASILIHAAAGGVGTAAVQLCKSIGAKIFATCGAEKKVEFLHNMGVQHVINYREQDFEKEIRRLNDGEGVDVVFDSVGGATFRKGYRLLNPMGRLVIFGLGSMMPSGKKPNWLKLAWQYLTTPRFSPFQMIPDNKTVAAFHLAYMFDYVDVFDDTMTRLLEWANCGQIKTVVDKTFPFAQAGEAHDYLQSRKSIGKVVLTL